MLLNFMIHFVPSLKLQFIQAFDYSTNNINYTIDHRLKTMNL